MRRPQERRAICLCRFCSAGGSHSELERTNSTRYASDGSAEDYETPTLARLRLTKHERAILVCPACGWRTTFLCDGSYVSWDPPQRVAS